MKRNILLGLFLFMANEVFSQNVTVYTVCTDDSDFSNVTQTTITQEEAETDYKTLILVYDNDRKEIIGGLGSYFNMIPTKEELKKVVNDAVQNSSKETPQTQSKIEKVFRDPYNKVLGLSWGMTIENAIDELEKIGLFSWRQVADDKIMYVQKVAWEGTFYGAVRLSYFTSNKQNKYLWGIEFMKICNNAEEAKRLRDEIKIGLSIKYGNEMMEEEVGENKFKYYMFFDSFGTTRINLHIGKSPDRYAVILWYKGLLKASEYVRKDNEGV